jgi:L-iditol 2-dehydrogenase
VAILGGGTIGLLTMQWVKVFGCKKVVVFDIQQDRLELALKLGADAVINSRTDDVAARVAELTDGKGFGRVFETAGNPATVKQAFEVAGNRATLCYIGTPHNDVTFTPKCWEWLNRKELRVFGSWMSYSAPYPGREWELTAHYLATGQLNCDDGLFDKILPMSEANEAFALYKIPGAVKGKLMLVNED